jgi:hypothetical protein
MIDRPTTWRKSDMDGFFFPQHCRQSEKNYFNRQCAFFVSQVLS